MNKKAQVITLANIKGGVGKSTATVNIAYLLSQRMGKKVLVVDADDQGNSSKALGVRETFDRDTETLWYALQNKSGYDQVMVESPYPNISVIAATKELKGAQLAFGQSARGIKLFKRLLNNVGKDFDVVLIDTKPQVNILLQAALAASNWYLIPSFPEADSYDGFIDLIAECEEIHDEENEELNCLGVLFTCVKKIPAHESYLKFVTKHLKRAKINTFSNVIRSSNAIATGSLQSVPAVALANSRGLCEDYLNITKQIVKIIGAKSARKSRPDTVLLGLSGEKIAKQIKAAGGMELKGELEGQLF